VELEAHFRRGSGSLTMAPVNKVHHVYTIARVAEMLGEDEDWLGDIANEMDQEDGLIWVYSAGDEGVMAFTDFGIETLQGLIEIHKAKVSVEIVDEQSSRLAPAAFRDEEDQHAQGVAIAGDG
jgi:hypothetical protein